MTWGSSPAISFRGPLDVTVFIPRMPPNSPSASFLQASPEQCSEVTKWTARARGGGYIGVSLYENADLGTVELMGLGKILGKTSEVLFFTKKFVMCYFVACVFSIRPFGLDTIWLRCQRTSDGPKSWARRIFGTHRKKGPPKRKGCLGLGVFSPFLAYGPIFREYSLVFREVFEISSFQNLPKLELFRVSLTSLSGVFRRPGRQEAEGPGGGGGRSSEWTFWQKRLRMKETTSYLWTK